jgi:hypothetical protein
MQPGEALGIAAQIAVALAGFAGVVVVFRSSSLHEWAPMDKLRLWILLGNALAPLFACLFGMLLLTINPAPRSIWHWCSGFSLLLSFPFGLATWRRLSGLGPSAVSHLGIYRYIFFLVGVLGAAVALLQIYNVLVTGVFWAFFAAVIFPLAVGSLQFAVMILLPPRTGQSP